MKLNELLNKIKLVQQQYNTSQAFLCGGTPRDKYLNRLDNVADLDITTGDQTVKVLAAGLRDELSKQYKITYESMDDGHSSIFMSGLKLDFSSNFIVPNIKTHLLKLGLNNPTPLEEEMYSRDFTCNALLIDLNLTKFVAPVKSSITDLNNKVIKTCLAPEITLTNSKNRVVRAIYLSSKLDFEIDESIISFVRKHPESVKISSDKSLRSKLNQAFEYNPEKAYLNITKMGLWKYIPITNIMTPYYTKYVSSKGLT